MSHSTQGGITVWSASNIDLPSGETRLYIQQYEVLPTDDRMSVGPNPKTDVPGYRLLDHDMIPLGRT